MSQTPLTVIAPIDKAFENAVRQQRLFCFDHQVCSSINEFFSPPSLKTNLLRHVFPWNISTKASILEGDLMSINCFTIRVETVQEWRIVFGGAAAVYVNPDIAFEFGNVIIVDDILMDYSGINVSAVIFGEQIIDIHPLEETERVAVAESLTEHVNAFRQIRSLDFSNASSFIPFIFQPSNSFLQADSLSRNGKKTVVLHSREEKEKNVCESAFQKNDLLWQIPDDTKRPKNPSDLAFMSVLELASLLRQGLVSSMELTELFLSRLRKADVYLELVVNYTEELAFQQAETADREMKMGIFRSPLHGIPYGLKDLIAVPNYPTTWGSEKFKNQTFEDASWVFGQLSRAGAVLIAKLATGEMALGDIWFGGRTKNPWNIEESSCGSSSGSGHLVVACPSWSCKMTCPGAATVAGLLPFAIGTETWGSISCPASTMGGTAIRPTFGSVGRTGTMSLAWSLDKIGCFCRCALDCALVMDSLKGLDPNDRSSVVAPLIDPLCVKTDRLTVGYVHSSDTQVVESFEEMGIKMRKIEIENTFPLDAIIHLIIASEASGNFGEQLHQSGKNANSAEWPQFIQNGRFIPAAEYILANRARGKLMQETTELFAGLDAILVPAMGEGNQGTLGNLIGTPEVVFPVGHQDIVGYETSPRKSPMTQALIGRPFSDGELLGIVAKYQEITDHHLKRPPVHRVEKHVLEFCLPFSRCSLQVLLQVHTTVLSFVRRLQKRDG